LLIFHDGQYGVPILGVCFGIRHRFSLALSSAHECHTNRWKPECTIQLYLRDVTAFDEVGRALLDRLAAKGIRLIASGVYMSYLR